MWWGERPGERQTHVRAGPSVGVRSAARGSVWGRLLPAAQGTKGSRLSA